MLSEQFLPQAAQIMHNAAPAASTTTLPIQPLSSFMGPDYIDSPMDRLGRTPRRNAMPGAWREESPSSTIGVFLKKRREVLSYNWHTLAESPLQEIAGSFGDLGTFMPLLIALAAQNSVSFTSTLFFSGLANIFIGLYFGIPLPVQPMKAIASVALARQLSNAETVAAGLTVAGTVLVLAITGLLRVFTDVVATPIVKGIQLGAGLSLILSSAKMLDGMGIFNPGLADNLIWFAVWLMVFLAFYRLDRIPLALIVVFTGVTFAFARAALPVFSPYHPKFIFPSYDEWRTGALTAGLGQIPLTILNSILATQHLTEDLYTTYDGVDIPTVGELGLSVALSNLGCFFGAMPVCHGAGGLAAQYHFGARSGSSVIILGLIKLFIAITAGDSVMRILKHFPISFLAVMTSAAAMELLNACENINTNARDLKTLRVTKELRRNRWATMLATAGAMLATKNVMIGVWVGSMIVLGTKVGEKIESKVQRLPQRWRKLFIRRSNGEYEPLL